MDSTYTDLVKKMELWTQYLVENQTAKELISALDNNIIAMNFSDVLAEELAEISEISPAQISEEELEESIEKAIQILLEDCREISIETTMQLCEIYKMTTQELIDRDFVIRWKNKFYQEK
jgi:hypothetical protein